MFKKLIELFTGLSTHGFSQEQREALLDAMVLTMYADASVTDTEKQFVETRIEKDLWQSSVPFDQYFRNSEERAIAFIKSQTSADKVQVIADIANRLGNNENITAVLNVCRQLSSADGDLAEEESEVLSMLANERLIDKENNY